MFMVMSSGPKDPFKLAVGQRLELLRLALEMRKVDFANFWGVTQQGVNNYAQGDQLPSVAMAVRLAEKTRISLDWLYKGDESGLPVSLYEKIGPAKAKLEKKIEADKARLEKKMRAAKGKKRPFKKK